MLSKVAGLQSLTLAVVGMVVTLGASAQSDIPRKQKAQLIDRVEARWEALSGRDYVATYGFQSPAYRSVFTQEMYASQFSSTLERELTSVEILNYDAAAAVASVAVGVMSRPVKQTSAASAAIQAKPVTVVEQWILRNNEWWFSVVK